MFEQLNPIKKSNSILTEKLIKKIAKELVDSGIDENEILTDNVKSSIANVVETIQEDVGYMKMAKILTLASIKNNN